MANRSSKVQSKATPNPTTHTTHTTHATATPALPTVLPNGEDLASLHTILGTPQESFTRMLFRTAREEDLVDQGARVDSFNIVADVPRFVASSLTILDSLDPARRATVMLPSGIFAVIVAEAVRLDGMKLDHEQTATTGAGERAERETTLRKEMRNGVALREQATAALGHALGEARTKELDVIVGDASAPGTLVKGMNAVADFIDRVLASGDAEEAESLAAWHVAAPRAVALRAQAVKVKGAGAVVANTGRRVSQRSLDLQDGRVLLLIDHTLRAFRTAHRADRSILVPELNRIAWLFETRSNARRSSKATPPPVVDAAAPISPDPK